MRGEVRVEVGVGEAALLQSRDRSALRSTNAFARRNRSVRKSSSTCATCSIRPISFAWRRYRHEVGTVGRFDHGDGVVAIGHGAGEPGVQHLLADLIHHRGERVFLAGEVRVERAGRDAGLGGDVGDPRIEEAVALEHPAGGSDQRLARPRPASAGRGPACLRWELAPHSHRRGNLHRVEIGFNFDYLAPDRGACRPSRRDHRRRQRHRPCAGESGSLPRARARSRSPTSISTAPRRSRAEIGGLAVRTDVSREAEIAALVARAP